MIIILTDDPFRDLRIRFIVIGGLLQLYIRFGYAPTTAAIHNHTPCHPAGAPSDNDRDARADTPCV
jgi:hypothetical protein